MLHCTLPLLRIINRLALVFLYIASILLQNKIGKYPLQMASSTDSGSQILQCSLNSLSIDVFFHHCSLSSVADEELKPTLPLHDMSARSSYVHRFLAFDRCLPTSKTMLGRGVSSIRHHFVHLISWVWHPSSFYFCCSLNHVIGTNMHSKKWKKKD